MVIIPAYNEAKSIGRVIRGLFEQGWKEVVVVDDGSADNTAVVAKEAGAMVFRHLVNRGQGAALQTGDDFALKSGAQWVAHFDGDDQFNPADIGPALEKLKTSHADVLLGSRFLDNRSRLPPLKKFIILPLARLVNYLF